MKVSVLIPYYNDREFLRQAIESVLNQTFEDFELILVNHATTDDCREIAHSYNDSRIVHYDMEKNYGAGTGLVLRRVLEFAKGEYIKLFCADDILYKDGLKDLVEYMDSNPNKAFAIGGVDCIDIKGNFKKEFTFKKKYFCDGRHDEVDTLRAFFIGNGFIPYIGNIIRTSALKTVEIDVSFIAMFDMNLWLSLLVKGYKIGFLDKSIAGWRIHKNQMSSKENLEKMFRCRDVEHIKFIKKYWEIEDIELLKAIFPNNQYLKNIKNLTKDDLKFIISYEMLHSWSNGFCFAGYSHIYELIQNDESRKYLEEKFKFGIKELRDIYINHGLEKIDEKTTFFKKLKRLFKIYYCLKI